MNHFVASVIVLVAVIGISTADLQDEIKAANVKFMSAFNSKDLKQLSELYTINCKLMPTGSNVMTGRDGVMKVFGSVQSAGATSVVLTIDEVGPLGGGATAAAGVANGTMIYERSHYKFYKEKNVVFDEGKYVVIWQYINQKWYLYIDIFNTDMTNMN